MNKFAFWQCYLMRFKEILLITFQFCRLGECNWNYKVGERLHDFHAIVCTVYFTRFLIETALFLGRKFLSISVTSPWSQRWSWSRDARSRQKAEVWGSFGAGCSPLTESWALLGEGGCHSPRKAKGPVCCRPLIEGIGSGEPAGLPAEGRQDGGCARGGQRQLGPGSGSRHGPGGAQDLLGVHLHPARDCSGGFWPAIFTPELCACRAAAGNGLPCCPGRAFQAWAWLGRTGPGTWRPWKARSSNVSAEALPSLLSAEHLPAAGTRSFQGVLSSLPGLAAAQLGAPQGAAFHKISWFLLKTWVGWECSLKRNKKNAVHLAEKTQKWSVYVSATWNREKGTKILSSFCILNF